MGNIKEGRIWRTKEGEVIHLTMMDSSHLYNIFMFKQRQFLTHLEKMKTERKTKMGLFTHLRLLRNKFTPEEFDALHPTQLLWLLDIQYRKIVEEAIERNMNIVVLYDLKGTKKRFADFKEPNNHTGMWWT